jgi:ribosome recycling factor
MIDQVYQTTERKMNRAVEVLQHDLSALRTGRASPALLEKVQVDAYGSNIGRPAEHPATE